MFFGVRPVMMNCKALLQPKTERIGLCITKAGALFYDVAGSATKAAPIQIAVIGVGEHPTLQASDFLVP